MSAFKAYVSHKRVEAARITAIQLLENGSVLLRLAMDGATDDAITVKPEVVARYMPTVGDYLVRYAPDGYLSISPGQAFDDGYSLVVEKS